MSDKVVRCGYCGLYDCRCDASELRAERDALAAEVERMERDFSKAESMRNARLREALRDYGKHAHYCVHHSLADVDGAFGPTCTCGLDRALEVKDD